VYEVAGILGCGASRTSSVGRRQWSIGLEIVKERERERDIESGINREMCVPISKDISMSSVSLLISQVPTLLISQEVRSCYPHVILITISPDD